MEREERLEHNVAMAVGALAAFMLLLLCAAAAEDCRVYRYRREYCGSEAGRADPRCVGAYANH